MLFKFVEFWSMYWQRFQVKTKFELFQYILNFFRNYLKLFEISCKYQFYVFVKPSSFYYSNLRNFLCFIIAFLMILSEVHDHAIWPIPGHGISYSWPCKCTYSWPLMYNYIQVARTGKGTTGQEIGYKIIYEMKDLSSVQFKLFNIGLII